MRSARAGGTGTTASPSCSRPAYRSAFALASEHACTTVAAPSISTGIYGFPIELAAPIAIGHRGVSAGGGRDQRCARSPSRSSPMRTSRYSRGPCDAALDGGVGGMAIEWAAPCPNARGGSPPSSSHFASIVLAHYAQVWTVVPASLAPTSDFAGTYVASTLIRSGEPAEIYDTAAERQALVASGAPVEPRQHPLREPAGRRGGDAAADAPERRARRGAPGRCSSSL